MNDPLAPFLESRAYAVEMGATAEFRKMEWVALDEDAGKIYLAMSEINEAGQFINTIADPNANIFFGMHIDEGRPKDDDHVEVGVLIHRRAKEVAAHGAACAGARRRIRVGD